MVFGVSLVGFGVFGSSDESSSPEELQRTPIETPTETPIETATEVTTPGAGTSAGVEPESTEPPATTIEVDDQSATATDDPATEPSSPASVEANDPPAVDDSPNTEPEPTDDTVDTDPASVALPLGTAAPIGERYTVTVTDVDLDATELILAEEPANEPPEPGSTYVMVTLDAVFIGEGQGEPYFDLLVGAVADGEREFDDIDCLALTPDDMFGLPPLASGEGVVGTFCLVVPLDATDSLTFFVEEHESIADTRVWWSATD